MNGRAEQKRVRSLASEAGMEKWPSIRDALFVPAVHSALISIDHPIPSLWVVPVHPGIEPVSSALQADSLPLSHLEVLLLYSKSDAVGRGTKKNSVLPKV